MLNAEIKTRAKVFGGDTITSTDVTVAITEGKSVFEVGDKSKVKDLFSSTYAERYQAVVKSKLERDIDRMRTSPDPLPVLLVGGGSLIAPLHLDGASKVYRPPHYQVANAIGAAMGKLSALLHKIEFLDSFQDKEGIIECMTKEVTAELVAKGALESSVQVVDLAYDPIPYVDRTFSFEIKVVGDIDYEKLALAIEKLELRSERAAKEKDESKAEAVYKNSSFENDDVDHGDGKIFDHEVYKPLVNNNREWIISETDLDYIRIGTYILGCGGGGTPYPIYLEVRNMLRSGAEIRVINLHDAPKYAQGAGQFVSVGFAGSPTVADEQLQGDEFA